MTRRLYCDDCAHFVYQPAAADTDDTYNPCQKGHQMSFQLPSDYQWYYDNNYGFYRPHCADRQERTAP